MTDTVWNFFYEIIKTLYLRAPKFIGGQENQKLEDICAHLLGISSTYFFTLEGSKICEDKIHNVLTSYTTIFILVSTILLMSQSYTAFRFFYSIYKDTVATSEKRERNARRSFKASETRKKNSELFFFTSTIVSILNNDDLDNDKKIFLISESIKSLNDKTLDDLGVSKKASPLKSLKSICY